MQWFYVKMDPIGSSIAENAVRCVDMVASLAQKFTLEAPRGEISVLRTVLPICSHSSQCSCSHRGEGVECHGAHLQFHKSNFDGVHSQHASILTEKIDLYRKSGAQTAQTSHSFKLRCETLTPERFLTPFRWDTFWSQTLLSAATKWQHNRDPCRPQQDFWLITLPEGNSLTKENRSLDIKHI